MIEFFEFFCDLLFSFVGFLFGLPLVDGMDGFSLGDMLIAIGVMGIIISALIESVRGFNLSPEANKMNAADRAQWRNNGKVG